MRHTEEKRFFQFFTIGQFMPEAHFGQAHNRMAALRCLEQFLGLE